MSTPSLVISTPKALSADDFAAIHGSELHTIMVRNRSEITMPGANNTDMLRIKQTIIDWLAEACNSLYHITSSAKPIKVYIEGDADVVNFKMFFNGFELPEEEKKEPPPAPPFKGVSTQTSPTHADAREILKIIRERSIQQQMEEEKKHFKEQQLYELMKIQQAISAGMPPKMFSDRYIEETIDRTTVEDIAKAFRKLDK
jgi:hypothetical protein